MTDTPASRNTDATGAEETKALAQAVDELRKRCDSLERIRYAAGAVLFAVGVALIIVFGIDPKNIAKDVAQRVATDAANKEVLNIVARIVPEKVDAAVKQNVELKVPSAVSSQVAIELPRVLRDETLKPTLNEIERLKSAASTSAANSERDATLINQRLGDLKLQSREKDELLRELARRRVYQSDYWSAPDHKVEVSNGWKPFGPKLSVPCKRGDKVLVFGFLTAVPTGGPQLGKLYGQVGLSGGSDLPGLGSGSFHEPVGYTSAPSWLLAEASKDGELEFTFLWRSDATTLPGQVGVSLVGWSVESHDEVVVK